MSCGEECGSELPAHYPSQTDHKHNRGDGCCRQAAAPQAAGGMQCVPRRRHPPAMAMMRSTSAGFRWQRTARAPTCRAKGTEGAD